MVENEWTALSLRFPSIHLDEFVIMPNHIHGIVILNECDVSVFGAGTRTARTDL
jgi:REP element-mobilizing transposase RayT